VNETGFEVGLSFSDIPEKLEIPFAAVRGFYDPSVNFEVEFDVKTEAAAPAAPEPLRPVAEALVLEIGAEPVWIEESARPLYHAALAHGANHLVTLVAQSMQALRAAGVESPSRVLGPLVSAALDNALRAGDAALTGPVARGDAGTVAEHLRQLQSLTPDIRPTYVALARATAERALASGRLKPHVAEPLLDILATDQER
jgi:predicted short-subunit dehydrogenase-like oxidoreductase (DUF2520 family)